MVQMYVFQTKVIWVVMQFIVAVGYKHFGGTFGLHIQGDMEVARFSKTLVSYHSIMHCHPEDLNLKLYCHENIIYCVCISICLTVLIPCTFNS
jgi:hypothetical protein